ncbi:MAG TPA: 8-oxoguanine deaminase [Clostridia bacterium]|nr:8-oxoguanine deaminase [Clostridia bacterium]
MNNSLFIKNIKQIITCDANDTVLSNVNMLMSNGEIKYIGKESFEADKVLDATGMVMYPGLVNTHHHLYQIFTRNLPQVQNLELFDWLITLYEIWKNLDSEVVYYTSLAGMGELLKNGCTTCFDHHYVFPKGQNNLIETQFEAADMLGIRMHASRGSMSLSKKDGGLPPDSVVQTTDEILADSQRLIEKFHDSSKFSKRQVALAPCSPFSVTQDLMIQSAKLARDYGVRLHTHLAETRDEDDYLIKNHGIRPLEFMEKLGWIGSDVWFAHGIHFNESELKTLAATGTGVAHCPISNMKLSSGIAKIPKMLELGVPVGLAVDGSASNDGSNLLEEIRVAYLLHRLNSSKEAPSGYDILKIATKGSARILGRNDIGVLSEGYAADAFLVDSNRMELVGTEEDYRSVFGAVGLKGPVDFTIVGGQIVVEDGKLKTVDEEELAAKANLKFREFYHKS